MVENEHFVHPQFRLGKRKPDPSKPRLRLASLLTGVPPQAPVAAEHFSQVNDWGLYTNNEFGVCGPTSLANSRKLVTKYLADTEENPALDAVYDLYRRSGNPNFDPTSGNDDNGVILQDMLSQAVKGGLGGVKPLAFADVDHTNIDEMMTAIAIFGFLIIGVDLETAQQAQTNHALWDYSKSGEWGGHAILGGRYNNPDGTLSDRIGVITWAQVVDMTHNFIDQQLDEAWVVIWPEHFKSRAFLEGVDTTALAESYKALTGRTLPVPTPVTPPEPAPQPTPGGGANFQLDLGADAQIVTHVAQAAARAKMTVDEWAVHHFRTYFKIR